MASHIPKGNKKQCITHPAFCGDFFMQRKEKMMIKRLKKKGRQAIAFMLSLLTIISTVAASSTNITWKARVEWIQNVRRVTAEFVTAIYKYLHTDPYDVYELYKNLEIVQEKKCLLILYFGPDDVDIGKARAQDICDKNTNNAKNEMVVDLINSVFNQLRAYFQNESLREQYHSNVIKCMKCKNSKQSECMYGESEADCIKYKNEQLNFENECIKTRERLFDDVELLIEAMRIYLKLEWKYTKNRKK